jgi:alkylhydroperoxidase/carboxymuconolactone decarboxylase family protein YurZ
LALQRAPRGGPSDTDGRGTGGVPSRALPGHLKRALGNGLTETELTEAIIHLAFYAGWPRAMSAITVAKQAFER